MSVASVSHDGVIDLTTLLSASTDLHKSVQTSSGTLVYRLAYTNHLGQTCGNEEYNKKLHRLVLRVSQCIEKMKFPQFDTIDIDVDLSGKNPKAGTTYFSVHPMYLLEAEDFPKELILKHDDPIILNKEKRQKWVKKCTDFVQSHLGIYKICEENLINSYWMLQYVNPDLERKAKDFIICHELGHIQQHMEKVNLKMSESEKELDADKRAAKGLGDISGGVYSFSVFSHSIFNDLFPVDASDEDHPHPKTRISVLENLQKSP